jgi:hypothetical protein
MSRGSILAVLAAVIFLCACDGSSDEQKDEGAAAVDAETQASGAPSARRGPSKGELRVADNFILASTDADISGFVWMAYGVAEALMRVRHQT